jgi:hypothetical protein
MLKRWIAARRAKAAAKAKDRALRALLRAGQYRTTYLPATGPTPASR